MLYAGLLLLACLSSQENIKTELGAEINISDEGEVEYYAEDALNMLKLGNIIKADGVPQGGYGYLKIRSKGKGRKNCNKKNASCRNNSCHEENRTTGTEVLFSCLNRYFQFRGKK